MENLKKYFFISFFLHLTLFAIATFHFRYFKPIPLLGHTEAIILNSYIHSGKLSSSEKKEEKTSPTPQKKIITVEKKGIEKQISTNNTSNTATSESKPAAISLGQDTHLISALLHDAIQKEQHYPPAALQMERQGRVTVAFILMLNGYIKNLKIVSSSGTGILDQAALNAVSKASPFLEVIKHIHQEDEYQIDVVFELT